LAGVVGAEVVGADEAVLALASLVAKFYGLQSPMDEDCGGGEEGDEGDER